MTTLYIRLYGEDEKLKEKVDAIAKKTRRSRSQTVALLIEVGLQFVA